MDAILHGSVEQLDSYAREVFQVGLSLAGNGLARGKACVCSLRPQGQEGDESCRAFAESLFASPPPRIRCPEGYSVVVRPVHVASAKPLLLASNGFLEEGADAAAAGLGDMPRLAPGQISLLESFVDMGAGLLDRLAGIAGAEDAELLREEAWRDLLGAPSVVGVSAAARALRETLPNLANSRDPLFIEGEPGTGRQLLAAAIHRLGPRASRPFIAEALDGLPEVLQESELFGDAEEDGLAAEADDGTLYLGGVEHLTPRCQELLLELLTPGETPRLRRGPRIIASANADLNEAVAAGRFNQALAARLRTLGVTIPPLRERPEDVPSIAAHLVRRRAAASGLPAPIMAPDALEALKSYPWAGNVRELDEELARATAGRTAVRLEDLSGLRARAGRPPAAASGATLRRAVGELEATLIEQALAESNGNKSRAARALGLSRLGLQKKMDRYGIERRR